MARAFRELPEELPPVTEEHMRAAFVSLRWVGARYDCAMEIPYLRQQIQIRAAVLRKEEWKRTTKRTVVPVPRVVLGADGHPLRWVTQMVEGPRVTTRQLDLLENF